jgi:hypothetical protein
VVPEATATYDDPVRQTLMLPAGAHFGGAALEAVVLTAATSGAHIVTAVVDGPAASFVARPRRGLVVAATPGEQGGTWYAVDRRHARRTLARTVGTARLVIPAAYRLDEITVALLWAAGNLDEALLDDDRQIAEQRVIMEQYTRLTRSSAGRACVADLNPVSALWLGSDFCARHILRHRHVLDSPPTFWTREQRGEEASAWLFFAHKFEYLVRLGRQYPSGEMTRTFCVPEDVVNDAQLGERVLVFLAMALMESFGIRTRMITEPEYAHVDGFALSGQRRAVIANWVGCDGIWLVDVTEHRPTVRSYADAIAHVAAHGLTAATLPGRRLRVLADYLHLDWAGLVGRCSALAEHGLSGLIDPRSRLLSVAGAERACGYVAELRTAAG